MRTTTWPAAWPCCGAGTRREALADFTTVVRNNPASMAGQSNLAFVLADVLNRPADAVEVLDRALKRYPDSAKLLGGRGVYLARLGKRDLALKDARACLLLDTRPDYLYQTACIYALTSRLHEEDRREGIRLFARALRKGFINLGIPDKDPDMAAFHKDAEFRALLQSARRLHATPAPPGKRPRS